MYHVNNAALLVTSVGAEVNFLGTHIADGLHNT